MAASDIGRHKLICADCEGTCARRVAFVSALRVISLLVPSTTEVVPA